jgi:hypothetical protein
MVSQARKLVRPMLRVVSSSLLNFRDQKLTFDHLVEIRNQSVFEEDEGPEPEP